MKVPLYDPNTATVFISGFTYPTVQVTSSERWFGASSISNQTIESVSQVAKERKGELLLSVSYDNKKC